MNTDRKNECRQLMELMETCAVQENGYGHGNEYGQEE
jgi:hypothetical protein